MCPTCIRKQNYLDTNVSFICRCINGRGVGAFGLVALLDIYLFGVFGLIALLDI